MIDHLLTQTCTVERWTRDAVNSQYEYEPDWVQQNTGVPIQVQEKGGKRQRTVGGQEVTYNADGFVGTGTDLKPRANDEAEGDRIIVDGTGVTYNVRAVLDETGLGEFYKVLLES